MGVWVMKFSSSEAAKGIDPLTKILRTLVHRTATPLVTSSLATASFVVQSSFVLIQSIQSVSQSMNHLFA